MRFRQWPALVWIGVLAVILRVAVAFLLGNQVAALPGVADQISYDTLAVRVLDGHGFTFDRPWWPMTAANAPTAHWSYLYTFYLVGVYALFGPNPLVARVLQAIIVGTLHPYLAYWLGCQVSGRRVGLITAMLTAIYGYFVYYAAALMTEAFYITVILAGLCLIVRIASAQNSHRRKLALGLGLALGVAVLLRQVFLLTVPVLFLWLWWSSSRRGGARPVGITIGALVTVAAMIVPFTVYNYARFGQVVLLNTNAGYAFFWGNHPIYGTRFQGILPPDLGTYEALIPGELRGLDEAALDKALLQRGVSFVLDDPARYALLSLSRIPVYFMFWPSADSTIFSNIMRVASFGLVLPFLLYGLLVSYSQSRRSHLIRQPAFLLFLFAAAYSVIHLLSWALIRYRLPVDAVLLPFAAVGIATLLDRFRARILDRQSAAPLRSGTKHSRSSDTLPHLERH